MPTYKKMGVKKRDSMLPPCNHVIPQGGQKKIYKIFADWGSENSSKPIAFEVGS